MFGYVLINKPELKIKEFDLYKSYYCGLCRSLKRKYGFWGRMTLNYDMNFLVMLLSDLYDKENCDSCHRCIVHPIEKHCEKNNEFSDYCADMCIYLTYYKFVDDCQDNPGFKSRLGKALMKGKARKVEKIYPEKTEIIKKKLNMLSIMENAENVPIDKVARTFGEIMGEVFVYKEDIFKDDLYRLGLYLGKFIYLLDAYEDLERDIKAKEYNPFAEFYGKPELNQVVENLLLLMIGEATEAFEKLPLIENAEILRNILYSGVWIRYNNKKVKEEKDGSI